MPHPAVVPLAWAAGLDASSPRRLVLTLLSLHPNEDGARRAAPWPRVVPVLSSDKHEKEAPCIIIGLD
jgi:hypothetical protein